MLAILFTNGKIRRLIKNRIVLQRPIMFFSYVHFLIHRENEHKSLNMLVMRNFKHYNYTNRVTWKSFYFKRYIINFLINAQTCTEIWIKYLLLNQTETYRCYLLRLDTRLCEKCRTVVWLTIQFQKPKLPVCFDLFKSFLKEIPT